MALFPSQVQNESKNAKEIVHHAIRALLLSTRFGPDPLSPDFTSAQHLICSSTSQTFNPSLVSATSSSSYQNPRSFHIPVLSKSRCRPSRSPCNGRSCARQYSCTNSCCQRQPVVRNGHARYLSSLSLTVSAAGRLFPSLQKLRR